MRDHPLRVPSSERAWKVLPSIVFLLFAAASAARSQDAGIQGRVLDEQGRGMPSATIRLEGTTVGTVASDDGSFSLEGLDAGTHVLVITYVGYSEKRVSVEVAPAARARVNVSLAPDVKAATVVIHGRANEETAAAARNAERRSNAVVTVLSAQEIARYPDPSTAESMQRIPGVSITRVRGEARDAIVRGLEARYNSTLIDGVAAPSPSTNTRVLQLDFLPSDLLQRIEVVKSPTPEMESNAIGGSVNLIMRCAPDRFVLRGMLGTGYTGQLLNHRLLAFRSDSVSSDDPIALHGTGYQATPADFSRDNLKLFEKTPPPDMLGEFTIAGRALADRLGLILAGSLQQTYRRSQTVRNYDAVDADNNEYLIQRQYRIHGHERTKWGINAKADFVADPSNEFNLSLNGFVRRNQEARELGDTNHIWAPVLYHSLRSVVQTYTLLNATISARHDIGWLGLRWKAGALQARQTKPDRSEITTVAQLRNDTVVSQPVFFAVVNDWQQNSDHDLFASLDVDLHFLNTTGIAISAGGIFKSKDRENTQNEYRLLPKTDSAGNLPVFTGIDDLQWTVQNTGGTPEYGNNNYTCTENIAAGYLMGRWTSGQWNVVAGVRVEQTSGTYATFDVNSVSHLSANVSYADILPSAHLRFAISNDENLRLSLGRTISRPNFYDQVPYNAIGENDRERGNPALRRTRSTNVDLRYERYLTPTQQISLAGFFKDVTDPIERVVDISNPALPTIQPRNLGSATIFGLEGVVSLALPFDLETQASYTWTHSSITSDKIVFDRANGRTLLVPETRPLQGQSNSVASIALLYAPSDASTTGQISVAYTGSRIQYVSLYKDLNHIQSALVIVDAQIEHAFSTTVKVIGRFNNLTNATYRIVSQSGMLIEEERYGATASIGMEWNPHR